MISQTNWVIVGFDEERKGGGKKGECLVSRANSGDKVKGDEIWKCSFFFLLNF